MTFATNIWAMRPGTAMAAVFLALLGPGVVQADVAPTATQAAPPPPSPVPRIIANPAEMMAAMARELDKHPENGLFVLEKTPITQAEVADVIRSMPVAMASLGHEVVYQRALETMIGQKAMYLNALKEGFDKDPAVIRRAEALRQKAIADAWLTRRGDAAINDQALHALYDRDIAGRPGPTEVRARLIVVPTEELATALIAKAQQGADFAELARTNSKDGSAANGGDLGYATLEALTPEVGYTAFTLQLGQVSPFPVRSALGYFIVRVEGRRQRAAPTFEEARPQLEGALRADAIRTSVQNVLSHVTMAPTPKPANAPAK